MWHGCGIDVELRVILLVVLVVLVVLLASLVLLLLLLQPHRLLYQLLLSNFSLLLHENTLPQELFFPTCHDHIFNGTHHH